MSYFFKTDDPIADFDRYCAEQEKRLAKRPKCANCEEPIQEDVVVRIGDDLYCDDCIRSFRIYVDWGE